MAVTSYACSVFDNVCVCVREIEGKGEGGWEKGREREREREGGGERLTETERRTDREGRSDVGEVNGRGPRSSWTSCGWMSTAPRLVVGCKLVVPRVVVGCQLAAPRKQSQLCTQVVDTSLCWTLCGLEVSAARESADPSPGQNRCCLEVSRLFKASVGHV